MKQRGPVHLLGMLVAGLIAGCGSSPSSDGSQDDPVATADFSGVYRPTSGGGDIAVIAFKTGQGYMMMPTGCTGEGCAEAGTYTLDPERTLLTLTDSRTGAKRVIDVRVLKTTAGDAPSGESAGGSLLGPRDFAEPSEVVTPGQQTTTPGAQLNNGSGQQLSKGGQATTNGNPQALLSAITSAVMNGAQMAQQAAGDANNANNDNNNNTNNPSNPALQAVCSQPAPAGVMPTGNATQADFDTYFATCPNGPNTGSGS